MRIYRLEIYGPKRQRDHYSIALMTLAGLRWRWVIIIYGTLIAWRKS